MPQSILGKWSVGFGTVIIAFFLVSPILMAINQHLAGDEMIVNLPVRSFLIAASLLVMVAGLSALFTGLASIIKNKERSILVFISTAIGFLVLIFLFGEFLFPH